MVKWSVVLVVVAMTAVSALEANGGVILPTVEYRIRDYGGDGNSDPDYISTTYWFILDAPLDQEDETYVEFSMAGQTPVISATLSMLVSHLEPANPTFKIAHYSNGTGTANMSLWRAGTYLTSKTTLTQFQHILTINVTDVFNDAVAAGDDYLGIRLYDTTFDTQVFYHSSQIETIVPEPLSVGLLGTGLAGLLTARRTRKRKA